MHAAFGKVSIEKADFPPRGSAYVTCCFSSGVIVSLSDGAAPLVALSLGPEHAARRRSEAGDSIANVANAFLRAAFEKKNEGPML